MSRSCCIAAGLALSGLVACGTGAGAPATPDPTLPGTAPASTAADTTVSPTTVELRPLLASNPLVDVVVDGVVVDRLNLRFDEWDGERQEPADRSPSTGIVIAAGSTVELARADATGMTGQVVRLAGTSRFAVDTGLSPSDDPTITFDDVGLYAISERFEFGPSDSYAGEGALWAATWVQVVAPDAECVAPGPGPIDVSALTDDVGCPAETTATLDTESLLPWFHCESWPPRITWPDHPFADADVVGFDRVDIDTRLVEVVDVPTDAEPAGFRLPAGPILVAPSDPDALFVELPDGSAERWTVPPVDYGCA